MQNADGMSRSFDPHTASNAQVARRGDVRVGAEAEILCPTRSAVWKILVELRRGLMPISQRGPAGALGWWRGGKLRRVEQPGDLAAALARVARPLWLLEKDGAPALSPPPPPPPLPLLGHAPACRLEDLGDPSFCRDHGLRYAYASGSMANGIASVEVVEAMSRAGMLGFFGAAGLGPATVEQALDRLASRLGARPWGSNLIHSPYEPALEAAVAELYIRRGVRLVCASAYLDLTLPVVRYRVHGLHEDPSGRVVAPNRILAKVSRVEVARKFLAPPPERFLRELLQAGDITEQQARLAERIPMAQDLTVEADSGGHTDNRPALALLPTMLALRDRMQSEHRYDAPLRVGAAGGISTPHSAIAAFAMGAAYVLTGSVNQACLEAGTSDAVRQMLAESGQADVTMAPAADMFEMGVKLQVLKRGTMFAMRAQKLYDLYRAHDSLEALPASERASIEKTIFRAPLESIWDETRDFWAKRDPEQIERAELDPKHRMALVFRWYLGLSSRWANHGEASRKIDYQVWCGPAMGAFNEWVRGSFLEAWQNRRVVPVALNILHGACVLNRVQALRCQGVSLPRQSVDLTPREPAEIQELLL
jgi:trans-AT polyketide synthase, acyltransferase and oxidoreductase domains